MGASTVIDPAATVSPFVSQGVVTLVVLFVTMAAVQDVLSFRIANAFPVILIALFALTALTGAWTLMNLAWSLGLAFLVFVLGAGLFYAGVWGGGDTKLLAALTLWVQPGVLLVFIAWVAIAGGGVALILLLGRLLPQKIKESHIIIQRLFTNEKGNRQNMPYGLAIMVATLIIWRGGGLGPSTGPL